MKRLLKITKYLLYALLGIVIALLLLPFIFEDQLKEDLKAIINENVNATVDFEDVNISFFKSFPDVNIGIEKLDVIGKGTFEDTQLLKCDNISFSADLSSFIRSGVPYQINSLHFVNPDIHLIIVDSLTANYNIVKENSDSETPEYTLRLDGYSVTNGKLYLQDFSNDYEMLMTDFDHQGDGNMTANVYDLNTKTEIESLSFTYGNVKYIREAKSRLNAKVNIDLGQEKYTLKENELWINDLQIIGDGYVKFLPEGIETVADISAPSEKFKDFFSIIPYAYTADYASVTANGDASLKLNVDGIYNSLANRYPSIDARISFNNGYVKYPDLPSAIENIRLDAGITSAKPDLSDMNVNVSTLNFMTKGVKFNSALVASNLFSDTKVSGTLKSQLDLSALKEAFPLEGLDDMQGSIEADLEISAKASDVENRNYNALKFSGSATADDIGLKFNDKDLSIPKATLSCSPEKMTFNVERSRLGKSDFEGIVNIDNPLSILTGEEIFKAIIQFESDLLDLDEWMETPSGSQSDTSFVYTSNPLDGIEISATGKVDQIRYGTYELTNNTFKGNLRNGNLSIENAGLKLDKSDINISGNIDNIYEYVFEGDTLTGDLFLTSNFLDCNTLMEGQSAGTGEVADTTFLIPGDIDLNFSSDIKKLKYGDVTLEDVEGSVKVSESAVALQNVKTKGLGGKMVFDGLYDSSDPDKPAFSFKYDLSNIKFDEAAKSLSSVQKLAPVVEYFNGFFNSTLVVDGILGKNNFPELSTLNASGFLETVQGVIEGFDVFKELGDKLGVETIKNIKLDNTKNWFEIVDGQVEIKPFDFNYEGIAMTISGKHGLEKDMEYVLNMAIPRSMFKKNVVGASAEKGLAFLEKEATKLGFGYTLGENINLKIDLTGTIKDPKFKITPVASDGKSVESEIKDELNDQVNALQDSIKTKIDETKEEVRDTVENIANEVIDSVKDVATETIDEVTDTVSTIIKDEVTSQIDTLLKNTVSDSLKQVLDDKAKDVLGNKGKGEVDKIKDKLKGWNPFKKKSNKNGN